MDQYIVSMHQNTRHIGNKELVNPIKETIIAEGFESLDDAERYAMQCRAVHFHDVTVKFIPDILAYTPTPEDILKLR